ncbi:uncharacterized protein LOC123985143 isoform X4 [Micropterus dolomieu]|uniref:uncharacterized protein LOC123985143 isoform X3 n=1 Tax=Micropterus dolomieu TaxID=147949 RepID=UPI001E8D320D|nr:uncharacterized protein LOC123985143 isoform X3 [Micropterus dolomieu]XP_045928488.1 uncharacterized protein LOC123985143 isoform X4 [Micropterus dolomieu]
MSGKKQRQKMGEKRENKDGSDIKPNKKVHAGYVNDLLTSHMSKPVAHRCTLTEIGNGRLMKQHTGNIMHTGSGELVSTHLPQLPVKAVAQQQVKKLSKRSSRHEKLPLLPADCSNKDGSHLRRDRLMPVPLRLIENTTQTSSGRSWSAGQKPETAVRRPTAELDVLCKLPDIKNTQVKRSTPKSGNLHRLPGALPSICERREELNKNIKLPSLANTQRAESPSMDKAKTKKKLI